MVSEMTAELRKTDAPILAENGVSITEGGSVRVGPGRRGPGEATSNAVTGVAGKFAATSSTPSSSEAGVDNPSVGAGGAATPAHPSLSSPTTSRSFDGDGFSTLYFANVTAMGKKAWAHIIEQQASNSCDFMGFVETHIGETLKHKWGGKFMAQKLKSIFTPRA